MPRPSSTVQIMASALASMGSIVKGVVANGGGLQGNWRTYRMMSSVVGKINEVFDPD